MRLLITTGIFPPDIGGPATYVPTMAAALAARAASVTVLTLSVDGVHDDARYPFHVVRIPRRSLGIRRMLQVVIRIATLARRHDLLFVPGLPVEAALGARLAGRPYVLKVVGDLAWERSVVRGRTSDGIDTFQLQRYGVPTELHRRLQTWSARGAARVVVPSMFLQDIVRRWRVADARIEVIPNIAPRGAGPPSAGGSDGGTLPDGSRRFRIVTVARLVPWKGIDAVIRGLATMDGIELLVLGDGPDRSRLEAVAETVRYPARFLGQVPAQEVLAILQTADLLILNSAYEGHSHVILEAMASGVPVVARAAGGTPELIRHREAGLLLPTGTAEEIAGAVQELREDSVLRERLGRTGRALAATFDLDHIADRTWEVLKGALNGFRGGQPSGGYHGKGDPCFGGHQTTGPRH